MKLKFKIVNCEFAYSVKEYKLRNDSTLLNIYLSKFTRSDAL